MERVMKSVKALLIAAILVVALSTCSNPFDFVAAVTDEVMAANDMYLEVNDVLPAKNAVGVNTWGAIVIEFDRDIDPATVTTETILLEPYVDWISDYNSSTHTLSITPSAFASLTSYTVTVAKGIKGTDGSSLRDPYPWSFKTKTAPGGSILVAPLTGSNMAYTKALGVTLNISYNAEVYEMRVSDDPSDFDLSLNPGDTGWEAKATSKPFTLSAGDGTKSVYIQFRDLANNRTPPVGSTDSNAPIHDTIVLDQKPPTVNVGTFPTYLNIAAPSVVPGATASDENEIASYLWTQPAGALGAVTFSSTDILNPTITGAVIDSTSGVQVRLRATDPAGNYSESTGTAMTVDRIRPSTPSFSTPASTGTVLPTWSWVANGGGNGTFQRLLTGGSWIVTTVTTYSPSLPDFGSYTLSVQERDDAGNWSYSGSRSYFYYPSYLYPAYREKDISTAPIFVFGEGTPKLGMTVWIIIGTDPEKLIPATEMPVTLEKFFTFDWRAERLRPLEPETRYFWQYVINFKEKNEYQSPIYYFSTGIGL